MQLQPCFHSPKTLALVSFSISSSETHTRPYVQFFSYFVFHISHLLSQEEVLVTKMVPGQQTFCLCTIAPSCVQMLTNKNGALQFLQITESVWQFKIDEVPNIQYIFNASKHEFIFVPFYQELTPPCTCVQFVVERKNIFSYSPSKQRSSQNVVLSFIHKKTTM